VSDPIKEYLNRRQDIRERIKRLQERVEARSDPTAEQPVTGTSGNSQQSKERKVQENTNGTLLLMVTGILEKRKYEIKRTKHEDGTVVLHCEPQDS
jgi:hypothetical protein